MYDGPYLWPIDAKELNVTPKSEAYPHNGYHGEERAVLSYFCGV